MYKRLKIIVPTIQVLIAIVVFSSAKIYGNTRVYEYCFASAEDIVVLVNLPVLVLWVPLGLVGNWLGSYLSFSRALIVIGQIVASIAMASSIGVLWYLVVVEVEKRRRGE